MHEPPSLLGSGLLKGFLLFNIVTSGGNCDASAGNNIDLSRSRSRSTGGMKSKFQTSCEIREEKPRVRVRKFERTNFRSCPFTDHTQYSSISEIQRRRMSARASLETLPAMKKTEKQPTEKWGKQEKKRERERERAQKEEGKPINKVRITT